MQRPWEISQEELATIEIRAAVLPAPAFCPEPLKLVSERPRVTAVHLLVATTRTIDAGYLPPGTRVEDAQADVLKRIIDAMDD